ncbi:hypothetical protein GALMADRAFT_144517 [Galerina marginata CBS 339.88]|uniref:Uncharacterized protein n=1 Tax=Galerina marginata (strain CBS 339.88) TaxID=685588 RepID=A0A067SSF3_GALM3|nr:hypothetical protein GALMADRAFT_144517 [Galerina marginata CBS 339.88]
MSPALLSSHRRCRCQLPPPPPPPHVTSPESATHGPSPTFTPSPSLSSPPTTTTTTCPHTGYPQSSKTAKLAGDWAIRVAQPMAVRTTRAAVRSLWGRLQRAGAALSASTPLQIRTPQVDRNDEPLLIVSSSYPSFDKAGDPRCPAPACLASPAAAGAEQATRATSTDQPGF